MGARPAQLENRPGCWEFFECIWSAFRSMGPSEDFDLSCSFALRCQTGVPAIAFAQSCCRLCSESQTRLPEPQPERQQLAFYSTGSRNGSHTEHASVCCAEFLRLAQTAYSMAPLLWELGSYHCVFCFSLVCLFWYGLFGPGRDT